MRVYAAVKGSLPCPRCGERTRVLDSRPQPASVRRRRVCHACTYAFYTLENEEVPLHTHHTASGLEKMERYLSLCLAASQRLRRQIERAAR